jgi:predicted transcriptional regulator
MMGQRGPKPKELCARAREFENFFRQSAPEKRSRGNPHALTDARRSAAEWLLQAGYSVRGTARILGVANNAVQFYFRPAEVRETFSPPGSVGEEWRPVVGGPSRYLVSSFGRVFNTYRGVMLAQSLTGRGYPRVHLPGRGSPPVHQLVLAAFVGPRPFPQAVSRHKNDVKTDNRHTNLEWGTTSQNMVDMIRNGRAPFAVLPDNTVLLIRKELAAGTPKAVISRVLEVSAGQVRAIDQGKRYRYVEADPCA